MNQVEHQATVDRGLKMKIKRKSIAGGSPKSDAAKHEIIRAEAATAASPVVHQGAPQGSADGTAASSAEKSKSAIAAVDKEKFVGKQSASASGPARGATKRANKDKVKDGLVAMPPPGGAVSSVDGGASNAAAGHTANGTTIATSGGSGGSVMPELGKLTSGMNIKKECVSPTDPYEFNAKVEDRIGLPVKKMKLEKVDNPTSPGATHADMEPEQHDIGTETCSVAIATDPDCLGPCEPGTSVVLEGIVWNETENGILVVNVTWRGKTYVGTLMDTTKHAWAPPRLNCDSPASDEGTHTPRGRGKRGRNAVTPPVVDLGERRLRKRRTNNNNPYAALPSPARPDGILGATKRRGRPADLDLNLDMLRPAKRARGSKAAVINHVTTPENSFIQCPEPNCMKKYKHINGLKYHQAHAHKKYCAGDEGRASPEKKKCPDEEKSPVSPGSPSGGSAVGRKTNSPSEHSSQDMKSDSAPSGGVKCRKNRKDDKIDNRKLGKQPTVTLTPVGLDNKTGVYASSVSSLGSVTTVSVLSSTAGTQSTATTTITTVPITTPTTSVEKSRKVKADKKGKAAHRLVAPPSGGCLPTVVSAQAQISIAASPVQTGSGLKPIQPKPTVLGETNHVDPLVGLKEKKLKKKKNRDHKDHRSGADKDPERRSVSAKDAKSDIAGSDLLMPLTVNLRGSEPLEALAKMSNSADLDKKVTNPGNLSPPELQKQPPALSNSSLMKAPDSVSARPPSSLSVNLPMGDVGGVDVREQNTNAQSPAYSDISDANDGSPSLDAVDVKNEPQEHPSNDDVDKAPPVERSAGPSGYPGGVYSGYYPPHSYQSPSAQSPQTNRESRSGIPLKPQSSESEKCSKAEGSAKKSEHGKDNETTPNGRPTASPSPVRMRDYQDHVLRAQQMAQYQQYIGAYGYGVDVRALASNPEYKVHYEWMVEQERVRREYMEQQQKLALGKGTDGKVKLHELSRALDLNTKAMDLSKQGKASPSSRSTGSEAYNNKLSDGLPSKRKSNGVPNADGNNKAERSCDIQNDGKNHVDGHGAAYPPGVDRRQDYKRFFMYQQQRLLEQKQYLEQQQQQQAKDGDRKQGAMERDHQTPSPIQRESLRAGMARDGQGYPREVKVGQHLQQDYHQNSEFKSDGDKVKVAASASSNSLPSSPGSKSKDSQSSGSNASYGQYYPQGYAGYPGHVPYDPCSGGYAQNPLIGYVSGSNSYQAYGAHVRAGYPDGKDAKSGCHSPVGGKLPPPPAAAQEGGKALDLLQQKAASYYSSQSPQLAKIGELKDFSKPDKPGQVKDAAERPDSRNPAPPAGKEKSRDGKSPPLTQRHIHTHHHTHLVGPAFSVYGSYSGTC